MFDEHDHHRIDPRIMFGAAVRAAPRPTAADDHVLLPAIGAISVTAMPPGKAKCSGKQRSVVAAEDGHERKGCIGLAFHGHDRREPRRAPVEPQEQWGVRYRFPDKPAPIIKRRKAILPSKLTRIGSCGQVRQRGLIGTKRIGAIEARTAEKWIRLQGRTYAQRRSPCGRELEVLRRRAGRATATSPPPQA